MIFQYAQLRKFFREINKKGETKLFKNWNGEKTFLLRHDVDFDIHLAHKLAQIEQEEGIVSTFFILTSCESYNILSKTNRALLKEMIQMGHEIGLHFDPTLYKENLEVELKKEIDVLTFAVGEEVKSVSLHNPSIHGQYPLFDGYINAYDPKMFSDKNYISDSKFLFRGKDPFKFLENINESMVQILLHPIHYSELGSGYPEIVSDTFISYMNRIHSDFKANSTYLEQVGEDLMVHLKTKL